MNANNKYKHKFKVIVKKRETITYSNFYFSPISVIDMVCVLVAELSYVMWKRNYTRQVTFSVNQ